MEKSFEASLVEQCAPTLAGVKAGSLFRYPGRAERPAAHWRGKLAPYGIGVRLVKGGEDGCLVYVYREAALSAILADRENRAFLRRMGYDLSGGSAGALRELSARLNRGGTFPHEIGLFLGYPLEDVEGFIENRGRNYTCCGCWKAYGDPEEARRLFRRCHRCTEQCRARYRRGARVQSLVVQ